MKCRSLGDIIVSIPEMARISHVGCLTTLTATIVTVKMFRYFIHDQVATDSLAKWIGPYFKRLNNQPSTNGHGDLRNHHVDYSLKYYFILTLLNIVVNGDLKDSDFYSSASY